MTQTEISSARVLEALERLNRIGAAINGSGPGSGADVRSTLGLVVESATVVIPGAAAVIYTCDPLSGAFENESRVWAGDWLSAEPGVEPRADGLGAQALQTGLPALSYDLPAIQIHPLLAEGGARTAGCFPLRAAGARVGALYLYLPEERPLTRLELLMLDNFVNGAAQAIDQARKLAAAQRDLARKDEELGHLRRAGLLISSRLRLEDTLEAILQMALEVTQGQYGIFRLADRSGQRLITRAVAGERLAGPRVEALPVDSNSIMGWVARSRRPALVADLRAAPWSGMYYPLDSALQMRSELAVPLIGASGRLEGVLNLESPAVGAFSEADSHLLQALAAQAVIAIQEVRLLDALQEVARLLLTESEARVLARLAELAADLLNAESVALWTLGEGNLCPRAASGSPLPPGLEDLARQMISGELEMISAGGALLLPVRFRAEDPPLGVIAAAGPADPAAEPSDWGRKVLAALANSAALAVRGAADRQALRDAQQQRAVAETFAVVGDIAANLLHQLNNQVGTIPVRIQGIQDKSQSALALDPYLAANLSEIERSAARAMETVRETLANLRQIELADVRVAECAGAALAAAGLPDGVRVTLDGLDGLPPVVAGQRGLTLVFSNLLQNAAEAMSGMGEIAIRGARRGAWVEVSLADNGPGVPAELSDRIFELDYSGRGAARPGKLGFGLWWVRTLMTRLGGTVSVENGPRGGALFRLRLPAAAGEGE